MSNENILSKIDRLGSLFAEMVIDPDLFKSSDEKNNELSKLMSDIIDHLVWNPGELFYDEDQERQKRNEKVLELLWEMYDSEEIFDELLSGGYSGLLSYILGNYSERVKMLKPTFISINPENTEFANYFSEAMQAWLYGLPNAALIICFAILEDVLKDRLCQINIDYVYELRDPNNPQGVRQVSYDRIIMQALNEGLIDRRDKNTLFEIKKMRNSSIHELRKANDSDVYDAIIQTKQIVEKLLRQS